MAGLVAVAVDAAHNVARPVRARRVGAPQPPVVVPRRALSQQGRRLRARRAQRWAEISS